MGAAAAEGAAETRRRERSLFVARLGGGWFAIDTSLVETVAANDLPRTRIPTAPAHIHGVVNHRGRALAVFDAVAFMGVPAGEPEAEVRLVCVSAGGCAAALPTSRVRGILTVPEEALRAPESHMRFTQAVVDVDVGLVQVLDLAALLKAAAARRE